MRIRKQLTIWILNLAAVILSLIFLVPLVVIFLNSFKSPAESNTMSMRLPAVWMFENYGVVMERGKVVASFLNSMCYAGCSAVLIVILVAMAAFVLSRNRSRIHQFMYYFIILGIAMPVSNVPLMKIMKSLHLINTRPGIILLYAAINIPISLFIVYGFVSSIQKEIDEAAIIDGCSLYGVYSRIILPLSKPILAVVALFSFRNAWNDYITSLIMTISMPRLQTLTVAVVQLKYSVNAAAEWHIMLAGASIAIIPILIVYLFANRQFIAGLTAGAVKG